MLHINHQLVSIACSFHNKAHEFFVYPFLMNCYITFIISYKNFLFWNTLFQGCLGYLHKSCELSFGTSFSVKSTPVALSNCMLKKFFRILYLIKLFFNSNFCALFDFDIRYGGRCKMINWFFFSVLRGVSDMILLEFSELFKSVTM